MFTLVFKKKYGYPSKYSFANFTKLISDTLHSKYYEGVDSNKNLIPDIVKNKIFSIEHFSSIVALKIKDDQDNFTKLVFNGGKQDTAQHKWSYMNTSKIKKVMKFFVKNLVFFKKDYVNKLICHTI